MLRRRRRRSATATMLEEAGAEIPPDDDARHVPRARFHAALARDFGPADAVEPLYLRVPDAEKAACASSDRAAAASSSATSARSSGSSGARTRRHGRARCSRASWRSRRRSASARSTPTTDALVGYLIISRYVDAWHVMNVAVDPDVPRPRDRDASCSSELFELTAGDGRRGYTLEVRVSNSERDPALRAARLQGARRPARLLHGQPRGRADHVEGPGRAGRAGRA